MDNKEHWHLDKRLPVALILTIMLQSGAAIWFAAKISFQVELNSQIITAQQLAGPDVEARLRVNTSKIDQVLEEIKSLRSILYSPDGK